MPGWDFDSVAVAASQSWQEKLSVIRAGSADLATLRVFYTALYHTMIAPNRTLTQTKGTAALIRKYTQPPTLQITLSSRCGIPTVQHIRFLQSQCRNWCLTS